MNKYSANGNSFGLASIIANLTLSSKPFYLYGFRLGFEAPQGTPFIPPGAKYALVNSLNTGTGWGNTITPVALDISAPASTTTFNYGVVSIAPGIGGTFVQFGTYYKNVINWEAKKGKSIGIIPAGVVGVALTQVGTASGSLSIDYSFQFEE